ncbi:MAG: hypothetical protein RL557_10 [archaeon]|jgi:hypothetical protein
MKKQTLKQAQAYAQKTQRYTKTSEFDSLETALSLLTLAHSNDENNFRMIIDSFKTSAQKIEPKDDIDERMKNNPLSYLEFLCITADGNLFYHHPFVPYPGERPIGEVQQYFNSLYGGHLIS